MSNFTKFASVLGLKQPEPPKDPLIAIKKLKFLINAHIDCVKVDGKSVILGSEIVWHMGGYAGVNAAVQGGGGSLPKFVSELKKVDN